MAWYWKVAIAAALYGFAAFGLIALFIKGASMDPEDSNTREDEK